MLCRNGIAAVGTWMFGTPPEAEAREASGLPSPLIRLYAALMDAVPSLSRAVRRGRAEIAQDTRARLLAAAEQTFVDLGYQAATLDHIAAVAGFTKGAVYWHFPTKQALFLALLEERHQANREQLEAIFAAPEENGPEPVRKAFQDYVVSLEEDDILPLLAMELEIEVRRNPEVRVKHSELVIAYEDNLRSVLERYYARIGIDSAIPLDELATTIITMVKGFALARQNRPERRMNLCWLLARLLDMPDQPCVTG